MVFSYSPVLQTRQVICLNAENLLKLPPRHRNTLKIYIFLDSTSYKKLESARKGWKHRTRKLLNATIFCYQKTIKNRHALHGFLQPWGLWLFALQMCSDSFNPFFQNQYSFILVPPRFQRRSQAPCQDQQNFGRTWCHSVSQSIRIKLIDTLSHFSVGFISLQNACWIFSQTSISHHGCGKFNNCCSDYLFRKCICESKNWI